MSAAPECNLINFIYLSYEYVLDEYFKKFKVKIILNIQAREGYSNIFSGVQNFGYFKVNSYDDSEVSNKQKSIIKEEIANALKEVPNIGIPFMDCLKDEFNFYTSLEQRVATYLHKDLKVLLENQFIKQL